MPKINIIFNSCKKNRNYFNSTLITDEIVGKRGNAEREIFEYDLRMDVLGTMIKDAKIKPYSQPRKMKHSQDTLGDFKVKYKFRSHEDGGRQNLPHQGIRSDFWYYHEDNPEDGVFMIWPLFEDEHGKLIDSGPVLKEGIARMKIVNDKMIAYHLERLKVGIKGYFMEGPHKTADCEVIELGERLKK